MLFINYVVLRKLRKEYSPKGDIVIIDTHDDMYRLLPNGDIYVHWYQEGSPRYTENGAYIGNLLKDCIPQPQIANTPEPE